MAEGARYTEQRIVSIRPWAPNLFSFRLTRDPDFTFAPGQFARLGVRAVDPGNPKHPPGEKIVWRAYSVVSTPRDGHLDFFSIVIANGEFTVPLAALRVGDRVCVDRASYGFFTTDRFEPARELWMLCTGTGLAPFLSMLGERAVWADYERLVVAHSVRYPNELAYADTLRAMQASPPGGRARLDYVPVVTRRAADGALRSRIPALVEDGSLQAHVGIPLDIQRSRVMICGNPDMVKATRTLLLARGFSTSRRGKPGQMAVENYW